MTKSVVTVNLDDETKSRLEALSAASGRPVDSFIQTLLDDHLDTVEYAYKLHRNADAIHAGEIETIPSDRIFAELFS